MTQVNDFTINNECAITVGMERTPFLPVIVNPCSDTLQQKYAWILNVIGHLAF
jgi:hypothetical protein